MTDPANLARSTLGESAVPAMSCPILVDGVQVGWSDSTCETARSLATELVVARVVAADEAASLRHQLQMSASKIERVERERDAALARVAELEAPGECASIHKLRAEVARLEAELVKPVAGAWAPHPCAGLARRELRLDAASNDDIAAGFTDGGWWVNAPGPSGGIVASGLETGEEGRRLADAAAVAAGWRLCDRA